MHHGVAIVTALAECSHEPQGGRWDCRKYMGVEVCGKALAIIGLGHIGQEVAIRMQSFGMRVYSYMMSFLLSSLSIIATAFTICLFLNERITNAVKHHTQRRWRPMLIHWCLCLKMISSTTCNALRSILVVEH